MVLLLAFVEMVAVLVLYVSRESSPVFQVSLFLFAFAAMVVAIALASQSKPVNESGYRLSDAIAEEQWFADLVDETVPRAGLMNSVRTEERFVPHVLVCGQQVWVVFHNGVPGRIRKQAQGNVHAGPTSLKRPIRKATNAAEALALRVEMPAVNVLLLVASPGDTLIKDAGSGSAKGRVVVAEKDAVSRFLASECAGSPQVSNDVIVALLVGVAA